MEKQIVRIVKDGKVADVWHGTYEEFNRSGYKRYERPFVAEYCKIEVIDIAEFKTERR